jgi:hypothetical protein
MIGGGGTKIGEIIEKKVLICHEEEIQVKCWERHGSR